MFVWTPLHVAMTSAEDVVAESHEGMLRLAPGELDSVVAMTEHWKLTRRMTPR